MTGPKNGGRSLSLDARVDLVLRKVVNVAYTLTQFTISQGLMRDNKRQYWLGLALLLICTSTWADGQYTNTGDVDDRRLSVLFLVDASWSMRQNDPEKLWRPAVQFVVSELSPDDQVAIAEFEAEGDIIHSSQGEVWISADRQTEILRLISEVRDDGLYTDFRAGLKEALEAFEEVSVDTRRIVLLLSDGVLDPNPRASTYTPHNDKFAAEMLLASKEEQRSIKVKYRQILDPIARRVILQDLLPEYRSSGVEIFTVALGPNADFALLDQMADKSSQRHSEVHSFQATKATDLVEVFAALLQYWSPVTIFKSDAGELHGELVDSLQFDQWVTKPQVVLIVDGQAEPVVYSSKGDSAQLQPSLHPQLYHFGLDTHEQSEWYLKLGSASGSYRSLWIGQNQIQITVIGLKEQYIYGDTVDPVVRVNTRSEVLAGPALSQVKIWAEIVPERGSTIRNQLGFNPTDSSYNLAFLPAYAGQYQIRFSADIFSSTGDQVLPRPGINYQFVVKPAFFVSPDEFYFENPEPGSRLVLPIELRSAYSGKRRVNTSLGLPQWNRAPDDTAAEYALPKLADREILISENQIQKDSLELILPSDLDWGDYNGNIQLNIEGGNTYSISYAFHIQSIWEKVRLPVALLLFFVVLLFGFLVYIWGYLEAPSGVLVPTVSSAGTLVNPIRLGEVKRGLFTKWLHWKRNRIRLRKRGGDISMPTLPLGAGIDIYFYRGQRVYLHNSSSEDVTVAVQDEGLPKKEMKLDSSWRLRHRTVIELGDNKYRYEGTPKRRRHS